MPEATHSIKIEGKKRQDSTNIIFFLKKHSCGWLPRMMRTPFFTVIFFHRHPSHTQNIPTLSWSIYYRVNTLSYTLRLSLECDSSEAANVYNGFWDIIGRRVRKWKKRTVQYFFPELPIWSVMKRVVLLK